MVIMKVLFLLHVSDKYGAGRSVLALIEGLLKRGVRCHCILPEPGGLVEELVSRGASCTIMRLPRWVSERPSFPLAAVRLAVNLLLVLPVAAKAVSWGADLFFSTSSTIPAGGFAAALCRKPHVWQVREFVEEDYRMTFDLGGDRARRMINRLSTQVIFVSRALYRKYLPFLSQGRGVVIHNEISLPDPVPPSHPPTGSVRVATLVGRIHPGKGQQDAVLAVSYLKEQGLDLQLDLIGDGDAVHTRKLLELVKEAGVSDRVRLLGFVENPWQVAGRSDLLLVCSHSGALDRVIVEGMLCGVPVIVARGGGNQEVVEDGSTGLFYPPGDHRELAQKMRLLLEDTELARQLARNGRDWAQEEFDGTRCCEKVYEVLEQALARR